MSFKDRKPFLKDFATTYLKNKIEDKTEAPEEAAAAAEEPRDEAAKAVETEADMAAEQPQEEDAAGEPAAGGAVAAPADGAAEAPEPEAAAPAAEVRASPRLPWHNGAQHNVSRRGPLWRPAEGLQMYSRVSQLAVDQTHVGAIELRCMRSAGGCASRGACNPAGG